MGDTSIEWTNGPDGTPGKTWNPIRGCSRCSPGCVNCYAERLAGRWSGPGGVYEGLVTVRSRHPQTGAATTGVRSKWTGEVQFVPERLYDPLKWKKPRRIFVNSMSDIFHERVTDDQLEWMFAIMALCPWHTFQLLTKRAQRMRDWFAAPECTRKINVWGRAYRIAMDRNRRAKRNRDVIVLPVVTRQQWPLPNVWMGISAEDQPNYDARWEALRDTPAAVRFISYEPALGPLWDTRFRAGQVDWLIAGCESGPGRRRADVEWFRSVRDACRVNGVAFFLKQLQVSGRVCKDVNLFPEDLRIREFPSE